VASYDHASAARSVVFGLLTAMKETREGILIFHPWIFRTARQEPLRVVRRKIDGIQLIEIGGAANLFPRTSLDNLVL
jgi:hypothetical protein